MRSICCSKVGLSLCSTYDTLSNISRGFRHEKLPKCPSLQSDHSRTVLLRQLPASAVPPASSSNVISIDRSHRPETERSQGHCSATIYCIFTCKALRYFISFASPVLDYYDDPCITESLNSIFIFESTEQYRPKRS